MCEHGFHFVAAHELQETGADGNQRAVAASAGGKGIGLGRLINGHFGGLQVPLFGLGFHHAHEPIFGFVARLTDHMGTHGLFGAAFRHEEGNQRAGKAGDGGEQQQAGDVLRIESEQPEQQSGSQEHGHIGEEEEDYALHGIGLGGLVSGSLWASALCLLLAAAA